MSGGVNSSVTAAMLVAAGFEVVGITLQLYDHGSGDRQKGRLLRRAGCARRGACRRAPRHSALRPRLRGAVSRRRDRGFRRQLPARRDAGPVHPLQRARQVPATCSELRATSARARWRPAITRGGCRGRRGRSCIAPATARATRAISSIARRRAELDFLRFPLGGLAKDETRALARDFALPVADKPDSQDICFVPQGSYAALVTRLRPEAGEPGDIVDRAGRLLGHHPGIAHFTVGQRKGLGARRRRAALCAARRRGHEPGRRRPQKRPRRDARRARRAELAGAAAQSRRAASRSPPSCARRSRRCRRRSFRILMPARPNSCSTRPPARSRPARRLFSTPASACSAAAGSAAVPLPRREHARRPRARPPKLDPQPAISYMRGPMAVPGAG